MSNIFKTYKVVATLPESLLPNTIYLVRVGEGFDLYCSDSTGSIAHKINTLSSYELAIKDGFSGTESDWLNRLLLNTEQTTTFNLTCPLNQITLGEIELFKTNLFTSISINHPSWFVLYEKEVDRTADLSRLIDEDPSNNSGVALEIINSNSNSVYLNPKAILTNSNAIFPFKITNLGETENIEINITYKILEV